MKTNPEGIEGLRGKEPIAAAVTLGVKHQSRGFPVEKDRFHIVLPYEADGRREHHPRFAFFNNAQVDKRKTLMGNLVHATMSECFEHHLKAQVLTKGHPNKRPACVGDGKQAIRWIGPGADEFQEIKCLNDRCEYRQCTPPKCKPWMRFVFRLRWDNPDLPSMTCKLTSGSWNTVSNFLGFFEYINRMAKSLKISDFSLYGLPFTMTLVERTKASAKQRFPTVSISPDMDPIDWLQQRKQMLDQISSPEYEALTDQSQQDPETLYEDVQVISAPARSK